MVTQEDKYPEFPKFECSACGERFEVPRSWKCLPVFGDQIVIDWVAGELLMKRHHAEHNNDLISGLENMLREDAERRGR